MKKDDNNITCDGCGFQTKTWNAIDNFAINNEKVYCRKCQKEMKIGWYAEGQKKNPPDDIIFAI